VLVRTRVGKREHVVGGNGQKGAIKGLGEVSVVRGDRMVDSHEIGAGGKRAFDHQGRQRCDDLGLDMAATEHSRANIHEVGDRVAAIPNELHAFSRRRGAGAGGGGLLLGGCSR